MKNKLYWPPTVVYKRLICNWVTVKRFHHFITGGGLMLKTSINYTAIAAMSSIQAGIKCSSHCLTAKIFREYNRNRVMYVSAVQLLVPVLSEMSDGIRVVSDEAETSGCCRCHQAWPISTSVGAVRFTEDNDQSVHHDQQTVTHPARHKSPPTTPTSPCRCHVLKIISNHLDRLLHNL